MACFTSLDDICSTPDMLLYCSESPSSLSKETPTALTCHGEHDKLCTDESDYSPTSEVFPIESGLPITPKTSRVCSSSQPTARSPTIFPLTPEATPRRGVKRSAPCAGFDETPSRGSKRQSLSDLPNTPSFDRSNFDRAYFERMFKSFDITSGGLTLDSPWRHTENLDYTLVRGFRYTWLPKLSTDELKRVSEAVLRQIDWTEVAEYAASNRGPGAYRRAVKAVLQNKVDDLADVDEFYEHFEKRMKELRNF